LDLSSAGYEWFIPVITMSRFLLFLLPSLLLSQTLTWVMPQQTRLLAGQRADLILEARGIPLEAKLRITVNAAAWTSRFSAPEPVDLDCDGAKDWRMRLDLTSFTGNVVLRAESGTVASERRIEVLPLPADAKQKNIILFVGDGTGWAYRDAARVVAKSAAGPDGKPGITEGFYRQLQNLDQMPVTGSVLTHSLRSLVPDSASTASGWSTGNKTIDGASGVWPDGTDCHLRANFGVDGMRWAADNPRIETLWELLKRTRGYRTGVVTTAYVADATPAGEGSHTINRALSFEIARQYLENPLLDGKPSYDVLMGGGLEDFEAEIRQDKRDLLGEFRAQGYRIATTAKELRAVPASQRKILGLFRKPNKVATGPLGLSATGNGNMDVAYDRLGLVRPGSEPLPEMGAWTDQPFLIEMTRRAIGALSGPDGKTPFVLLVEGASIDKQSHRNHAAGTIWDAIEFDQAIGVAREWIAKRPGDTLLLATADHDQTMSILGVADISDADLQNREPIYEMVVESPIGRQRAQVHADIVTNIRGPYNWSAREDPNSSGAAGPPRKKEQARALRSGFPDYQDANGDGYPENREANGKGRLRIAVGFRNGEHAGTNVPVSAEGAGAWLFTGVMDQTDLMFKMAAALGDTAVEDELLRRIQANRRNPVTPGKAVSGTPARTQNRSGTR
jgi:alkaline phosphatase